MSEQKPIEKIKEQAAEVRRCHSAILRPTHCDTCGLRHPCDFLALSENRLKLAEALDDIELAARAFREIPSYAYADNEAAGRAFDGHDDAAQAAAKALSEVAGGQK